MFSVFSNAFYCRTLIFSLEVILHQIANVFDLLFWNRLVELTSRHRQEVELESERANKSQSQLEKTQVARERAHKQRVKGLEEQVSGHFYVRRLSNSKKTAGYRQLKKIVELRKFHDEFSEKILSNSKDFQLQADLCVLQSVNALMKLPFGQNWIQMLHFKTLVLEQEIDILTLLVFSVQVATLKDQLAKELQKKQSYLTRTTQKSDEIRDLRGKLEDSLHTVARDTVYEPSVLERESQKLEDSVDASYSTSPMRRTKSASPPVRFPSDKIATSTPAYSGMSPSRRATPIASSVSRRTTPGVSPLRKTRKSTTWTVDF